jgi:hypothetical protein
MRDAIRLKNHWSLRPAELLALIKKTACMCIGSGRLQIVLRISKRHYPFIKEYIFFKKDCSLREFSTSKNMA